MKRRHLLTKTMLLGRIERAESHCSSNFNLIRTSDRAWMEKVDQSEQRIKDLEIQVKTLMQVLRVKA